jgi:multiple sugar transport system substrate-binding protein
MTIILKGTAWDHPRASAGLDAVNSRIAAELGARIEWDLHSLAVFSADPLAKTVEGYDLILFDHPYSGDASGGLLLDLSRYLAPAALDDLRADTVGFGVDLFDYDGGVWGLPIDAACQVAAFRPDLCARAGLDEKFLRAATLDEIVDALRREKLKLAISFLGVGSFMCFLSYCYQLGAVPFAREGEMVPREVGLEAIAFMHRIIEVAVPEVLDWISITCLENMARRDDLAYCPTIFGFSPYSHDGYGTADGRRPIVFTAPPLPRQGARRSSIIGGAGIGVSARTRHPELAARAVQLLMSRDIQREMALAWGQPGRRSTWTDPEVNAVSRGFFANTLETIEQGYIRPRFPGWVPRQTVAGRVLAHHLRAKSSPATTLDAVQAAVSGQLTEA